MTEKVIFLQIHHETTKYIAQQFSDILDENFP